MIFLSLRNDFMNQYFAIIEEVIDNFGSMSYVVKMQIENKLFFTKN
jgi:hypothetical protein